MTLQEACRMGTQMLEKNGIEEASLDAWYLLEYVTGISRARYLADAGNVMQPEQENQYFALIERRAQRIPLQHLTGVQEFMGLDFKVNEHVLIPRQDTEVLVETALEILKKRKWEESGCRIRLLDMCTGSGCILLSIMKYVGEDGFGLGSNKKYQPSGTFEMKGTGVDISEEAISENRAYVFINKQVERVSKEAVEELDSKEVILIFPSQRKNNKTVRVLKTPKTDTSERKVYIPGFVAQCLIDIKKEQDEVKEALGSEYTDYNLIMATTFGMPINSSYIRDQLQKVIDREGLPDVVFHSLRHTSVTYKLKLSGGDIKVVQGDSGHAQADMVTEVYGHIIDEDRRKNAQRMEDAFYNRENLNPQMKGADAGQTANTVAVPEGVDADLLMKVLGNPEMAALLTSLAKSLKAE